MTLLASYQGRTDAVRLEGCPQVLVSRSPSLPKQPRKLGEEPMDQRGCYQGWGPFGQIYELESLPSQRGKSGREGGREGGRGQRYRGDAAYGRGLCLRPSAMGETRQMPGKMEQNILHVQHNQHDIHRGYVIMDTSPGCPSSRRCGVQRRPSSRGKSWRGREQMLTDYGACHLLRLQTSRIQGNGSRSISVRRRGRRRWWWRGTPPLPKRRHRRPRFIPFPWN
jgi:hypothetical protein